MLQSVGLQRVRHDWATEQQFRATSSPLPNILSTQRETLYPTKQLLPFPSPSSFVFNPVTLCYYKSPLVPHPGMCRQMAWPPPWSLEAPSLLPCLFLCHLPPAFAACGTLLLLSLGSLRAVAIPWDCSLPLLPPCIYHRPSTGTTRGK